MVSPYFWQQASPFIVHAHRPAASRGAPQQYNYSQALVDSLLFYDSMRLGRLPSNNPISWRNSSLVDAVGPKNLNWSTPAAPNGSIAGGMMTGVVAGRASTVCRPTERLCRLVLQLHLNWWQITVQSTESCCAIEASQLVL